MNLRRNIPGATPISDTGGLLKKVETREELDVVEFANIAKATAKYLSRKPTKRMAPFTPDWMLKLHREMLSEVWQWAGKIRTSEKNIGVHVYQIMPELTNLAKDIVLWEGDLVADAASLHHRSVFIHPFEDGNGRWARLLANIWLKQNNGPIIVWPEPKLRQKPGQPLRKRYLIAVKRADKGDLDPLIKLHREHAEVKEGR